jgi:hypothetical protein
LLTEHFVEGSQQLLDGKGFAHHSHFEELLADRFGSVMTRWSPVQRMWGMVATTAPHVL